MANQNNLNQNSLVANDEAAKTFVGKNYDYFKKKWEIAETKKSKQSWNWAAFLVGFSWMAYRKMYLYSWIFIGVIVIEILCEYAFGFSSKLSSAINMGIAITFGWQGNYWYKLHVEKKVREIVAINSPEQAKIELEKQGGTSIGAAIGFAVAFIAIIILVAIVAEGRSSVGGNTSSIEQSACPLVTQIIHEQLKGSADCKVVKITEDVGNNFYKAKAILDNGNDLKITIERKGKNIYVKIPNQ